MVTIQDPVYQEVVKYLGARLDSLHHDVYANISLALRNYPTNDICNRLGVTVAMNTTPEMLIGQLSRQGITVSRLRESCCRLRYETVVTAIDESYIINNQGTPAQKIVTIASLFETNIDAYTECQKQFGIHWRKVEEAMGLTTEVESGDELLAVLMEQDVHIVIASMECVPALEKAARAIYLCIYPPAKQADQDDCVICMSEPKTHAMIPCGHRCICEDCATTVSKSHRMAPCPICRATVQTIVKIYLS